MDQIKPLQLDTRQIRSHDDAALVECSNRDNVAFASLHLSPLPAVAAGRRLLAICVSVLCLAVLVTAARIKPNPRGVGTHTQLGLQPCQFLSRTGLPAPTCGMTTSFAWFVRGNFAASFYVQPMGTVLAGLTTVGLITGFYIGATGRRIDPLLTRLPLKDVFIAFIAFGILAWGWKIFIRLKGIDGWT